MAPLVLGNGLDATTQVGPLISRAQQDNVASLVDGAVAGGATVLCGGTRASDKSFGYHPTVLTDVGFGSAILQEEVFGPVAPIVKFREADDILTHCNSVEHGLVSYVFTRDVAKGLRFAEALETGMIGLNRGLVSDPAAPFGGVKASGLGREGGHDGILAFLETKYVAGNW
jgi:succinate-semialdehyde dehydrogenase/glutarate-semialdehyde dehydrogenase